LTLHQQSHSFQRSPFDRLEDRPGDEVLAVARRKISTTIYITPEQSERLKLLHERTRVPVAEYIRQGIDMVLDHYRGDLPGQLTIDDVTARK
jgi:hypothetical protein